MTTDSLTEKQAKEALDFIAKKLGYDYVTLENNECRLVKATSAVLDSFKMPSPPLLYISEYNIVNFDDEVKFVHASSFKQVLEQVSGHACITVGSNSEFHCPRSLEELLVQMDLED